MRFAKDLVRRLARAAGFDIHRLTPTSDPAVQLLAGLRRFDVDLVLDVGANAGQFGRNLRSVGYDRRIVSFEPLSSAHSQLVRHAESDGAWIVHPRCAIGEAAGDIDINVAGNSVSSSLLPMLDAHSSAAPGSAYVGSERVQVLPLDTVAASYLENARAPFLKVDTQGYEWAVLDGAARTLPRLRGVLCELSLVPLYQGQRLWLDVIGRLADAGFALWSLQSGFTDPRDGRTLQADGVFFRVD